VVQASSSVRHWRVPRQRVLDQLDLYRSGWCSIAAGGLRESKGIRRCDSRPADYGDQRTAISDHDSRPLITHPSALVSYPLSLTSFSLSYPYPFFPYSLTLYSYIHLNAHTYTYPPRAELSSRLCHHP